MNIVETFKKNIDDAELLLIGIGEEFFPSIEGFEEEYNKQLFDDRISTLQMEPLFREVLLKRWINSHFDERLKKAYSCIQKLCENKNFYIVSLGIDDYLYNLNFSNIVTPCGGRRQFQRCSEGKSEVLDTETTQKFEYEIYNAFETCDFEKLDSFDKLHRDEKLEYNSIISEQYNEEGYLDSWNRYLKWLQGTVNRKVCVLELGVSLQLPSVIRWPFEKIVFYNNKAVFYRVNSQLYQMTAELKDKGVSIPENAITFLGNIFV